MARPASSGARLTRPLRLAAPFLAAALLASACAGDDSVEASARVAAEVAIDPPPGTLALADDGTVWVAASSASRPSRPGVRRHAVVRVDGRSMEVTGRVEAPHQMNDVAVGAGFVWSVGTDFPDDGSEPRGTLLKIDPAGPELVTRLDLGVGAPSSVAVGHGSVWVTDSREDRLFRVNPATAAVERKIAVSGGPTSVAADDRWVWVASPTTGKVHRVDPGTNVPSEQVTTGGLPSVVAVVDGSVWVSNFADEDLALVDASTVQVVRTVEFGSSASRLATDGDRAVAVEAEARRLVLVDDPDAPARVVLEGRFLVDVALDGNTVWAIDHGSDELVRVELSVTR